MGLNIHVLKAGANCGKFTDEGELNEQYQSLKISLGNEARQIQNPSKS